MPAKGPLPPLLKEKTKALVFVSKPARETRYAPTDEWLWLHHAHPLLVKRLRASAAVERPRSAAAK